MSNCTICNGRIPEVCDGKVFVTIDPFLQDVWDEEVEGEFCVNSFQERQNDI